MNLKTFKNKKILITGHTGFKGSWLTFWLTSLGAKVVGISNKKKNLSNYNVLKIKEKITNEYIEDIKNLKKLKKIINSFKPDYIFHLAAQSLVKNSFENPIETFHSILLVP